MAACLIALGSNLGDRATSLGRAVDALARLPHTRLLARSAWRETSPVGGPPGQGAFLNGAVLLESGLEPAEVLEALLEIEASLGRVRTVRWGERAIDLDLLLYADRVARPAGDALELPHPRLHYRHFVLAGAAEIAPWMVHPASGWTIARLLAQLEIGAPAAAVAAADPVQADELIARLNRRLAGSADAPRLERCSRFAWNPGPKVVLAVADAASPDEAASRRMLQLPSTGPIAWLVGADAAALADEAWNVLASVWPALAASGSAA